MTEDIIVRAFDLAKAVEALVRHARNYFFAVMLAGYACPTCEGPVAMVGEGRCRCTACGDTFDPTEAFQQCPNCGGRPRLRICRYRCRRCGRDVRSRFLHDARVFDREYFRQRMAESRERKRERRERVRIMLAGTRSQTVEPGMADLESVPGLVEALNGLVGGNEPAPWAPLAAGFDLNRYQTHLEAHIGSMEISFDKIPSIENDVRLDRVWRFIAIIFMAHAGLLKVRQEGPEIILASRPEVTK